jgi:hypothetical protein
MALDPQIRQGAGHIGGNAGRRSLAILEKAYCASKRRTVYALQDSVQKSFGCEKSTAFRLAAVPGPSRPARARGPGGGRSHAHRVPDLRLAHPDGRLRRFRA